MTALAALLGLIVGWLLADWWRENTRVIAKPAGCGNLGHFPDCECGSL